MPTKLTEKPTIGMNVLSASPYSVVNNAAPSPHRMSTPSANQNGARSVRRSSPGVGWRSSIAHRSTPIVRRVIQYVPSASATAT